MIRAVFGILLAASIASSLAGCSSSARAARDPNTLIVLELSDAPGLNPLFNNSYYAFMDQNLLFDQLVGTGNDFTDIPLLATSWQGTPDGLHWVVNLRRGVKWSDGVPFSSADVVWTWKTQLDPATGFPYRGQFAYIKSVRADGPDRVLFDLSERNALFISQALGSFWILPQHVLGKISHNQLRQSTFGEHPVGTGAYVLKAWHHDEQLTFEANPYWWGGKQSVKRIVIKVVLNDQARIEAMEEGSADIDDGLGPSAFAIFTADQAKLRLLHVRDLFVDFFYLNHRRPGLGDANVRRAMMYGWDRQALVAGLEHGDTEMATSIIPAGLPRWYDPKVRPYPYDPGRARKILDAAGYRLGQDGVRRKGSVRLAYVATIPNAGNSQLLTAEFQADMRDIGIAITMRTIDYTTFLAETDEGKYDMAFAGWGGVSDPDQKSFLGSDQFPPNGNNDMFYKNARVDRDLTLGLTTIDYAKRRAIYDDLQRVVAEDVPVVFYDFPYYRVAIAPRVRFDFARALPGIYLFRDVARWRLNP